MPLKKQNYIFRNVKLFMNGRSQAVRIPREMELPGKEVTIHKEGHRLIIEPIFPVPLAELLATWEPLNEGLPDIEDSAPEWIDLE